MRKTSINYLIIISLCLLTLGESLGMGIFWQKNDIYRASRGIGYNLTDSQNKSIMACSFPFYALSPKELCVRSEFYTSYPSSTEERKSNIKLAAKSINNYLLDVGAEFSFNNVVGARTEARGYKKAKIIVGGRFTDGVGGGVCQVSTTLYNAVLLAGLKITEYHSHSLPVSYIAPSFDAMVNSGSADLRFVNNTKNPIILNACADDSVIKITVTGERLEGKYHRESVVIGTIPAPKEEFTLDTDLKFPNLYKGEELVISYSKEGLKSEGYLVYMVNGKKKSVKKIRTDTYNAMRGLVILGNADREELTPNDSSYSNIYENGYNNEQALS